MNSREIWKPVVGYEGLYEVSDLGRVRSLHRNNTKGRIMKINLSGRYPSVALNKQGIEKNHLVHRLVLIAFKGEMKGFVCDHINANKRDNRLCNLRWVTQKQNVQFAYDMGNAKAWNSSKVIRLSDKKIFDSTKSCAELLNTTYKNIWRVCVGMRKTYRKEKYMYLEDYLNEQ